MRAPAVRYRSFLADSARWDGFRFRDGDIVISTPPKCGTTWMQMLCALLVFQTPTFGRPLGVISPWLDMLTRPRDDVVADLEAQEHRRFIKTHTPLDGLPLDEAVTYICVGRDPRDVALSFGHHMANIEPAAFLRAREAAVGVDDLAERMPDGPPVIPDSEVERFWAWVENPAPPTETIATLRGTLHHLATFWSQRHRANVVLFHYGDLQADLEGQLRRLASRLEIDVPASRWPDLVEAATFDRMRERADDLAPDTAQRIWRSNEGFFHRGTSGQWRALLDGRDLERYHARVRELAGPELADWVHGDGPLS
jgi:aryl sulfotransferase